MDRRSEALNSRMLRMPASKLSMCKNSGIVGSSLKTLSNCNPVEDLGTIKSLKVHLGFNRYILENNSKLGPS